MEKKASDFRYNAGETKVPGLRSAKTITRRI